MKSVKEMLGETKIGNIARRLSYLKARWKDEAGYEDFETYIDNISSFVPGASEVKLTKKFDFVFNLGGATICFEFKKGKIVYGQIPNN